MSLSQKTYYALRALLELARHEGGAPRKIGAVAEAQSIPPRFLEIILNQLKQAGFVQSRRGNEGGYVLARPAAALTVGQVIRFMDGPFRPVRCDPHRRAEGCTLSPSHCVFRPLWMRVEQALSDVYDKTTFRDLVEQEQRRRAPAVDFAI